MDGAHGHTGIYEAIQSWRRGEMDSQWLHSMLERYAIRGAVEDKGNGHQRYIGYDYRNQNWIRID